MTLQQMFVAFTCFLLASQQIAAVVNNSKGANLEEATTTKNISSTSAKVPDSSSSGTEQDAKRREAPAIGISDTYGPPLTGGGIDSYVPTGPSNALLPIPVYGVPDAPTNNIVYPAPPPDIPPPPLPQISVSYGTPSKTYGPPNINSIGSSFIGGFVAPRPPTKYLPPIKQHKPFHGKPLRPRPQYGPPHKPIFVPKLPKPSYGPPRPVYGPPKTPLFVPQKNTFKQQSVTILSIPSSDHGVSNIGGFGISSSGGHGVSSLGGHGGSSLGGHGVSSLGGHGGSSLGGHGVSSLGGHGVSSLGGHGVSSLGGHGVSSLGGHGVPDLHGPPVGHYGPPDPVPHGPPHPGVPAPPTPPDIKYDGWQPIPGLVSRPPSDSYGVPEGEHHGHGDLQDNVDFSPPPSDHSQGHISTSSHSINVDYSPPQHGVSDSYGAPLNSVTGSGAIVSSSGDSHYDEQSLSLGLSAAGIKGHNQLSVIKSIGYELFPNSGSLSHIGDSYSAPPLNSYSPNGPYAAAHSYKGTGGSSIKSHHNSHSQSHSYSLSSNIGLIPPSGVYGAPPNSHYGTPLLTKPTQQYGPPLNALKINPPKHPVIFREPVPTGLIESVGHHTAQKDAHGIIESAHSNNYVPGPTYIPPPIPDITKPVKEEELHAPTSLYSLPNTGSPVSFHGGSSIDISSLGLHSNVFEGGSHNQFLTSYTAPLGSIDGSYSLPLHSGPGYSIALDNAHSGGITVGLDNSIPPLSIDLTSSTTNNVGTSAALLYHGHAYQNEHAYQNGLVFQNGHDCSSHKSQPLPSLSYGVPSANSYTASLSSLTTNIGGGHQNAIPSDSYGPPDLQTEHSQKVRTAVAANSVDSSAQGKSYGKSLLQNFGPDAKLIKSESIDINSIPVKGSLGTYTLQIQPADDLGGSHSSEQVSHAHVLNGGLLQSILAAIEEPHRKGVKILGQPLSRLQPSQSYDQASDAEGQQSVMNTVVVPAPVTEGSTTTPEPVTETDAPLRLIDNNEIALYFSNNAEEKKNDSESSVLNGQQYGSYVSFKTPNTSYVYGDLKSDKSQETNEKNQD